MIVPERPDEFFSDFLPRQFEELAGGPSPGAVPPAAAPAPEARVLVRVVGAGEWSLGIQLQRGAQPGTRLDVRSGPDAGVALQLSLHEADFLPLVVEPARRALARQASRTISAAERTGAWARVSRWDREMVELLRQQPSGLLVRIDDDGTVRPVAVTPGVLEYSLEAAACTIDCRASDLREIEAGQVSPLDLFYSGRIKISGDAQIALALAGAFI